VAVPGAVPAIKDTITMPVSSDVETEMLVLPEKLPRSVVNVTVVPLWTGLPELSHTVAVIVTAPPSFRMRQGEIRHRLYKDI
jgi:hypothetical protein